MLVIYTKTNLLGLPYNDPGDGNSGGPSASPYRSTGKRRKQKNFTFYPGLNVLPRAVFEALAEANANNWTDYYLPSLEIVGKGAPEIDSEGHVDFSKLTEPQLLKVIKNSYDKDKLGKIKELEYIRSDSRQGVLQAVERQLNIKRQDIPIYCGISRT